MEPQPQQNVVSPLPVISLLELAQFLKERARRIAFVTLLFMILGVVWALTRPVEFSSSVRVLPELEAKASGTLSKLGSLAGLAGINLNDVNSTEAVRPDLYPNVLQSTPFALHMMKQKVFVPEQNKELSLIEYLSQSKNSGFSFSPIGWVMGLFSSQTPVPLHASTKPETVLHLTKEEHEMLEQLQERIQANLDKKTGIISIVVKMPNPIVAANVANIATDYLRDYVTTYRTGKTIQELKLLTAQTNDSKKRYEQAQFNLSSRKDQNLNLVMNTAMDRIEKLRYDRDLAYSIYSELSKKLEEVKIRLQEETPVFKILEPSVVPLKKSEPKRTAIVLFFTVVGMLGCTGYLFLKKYGGRILSA